MDHADERELEEPGILVSAVGLYIAAPTFEEGRRELAGIVVNHDEQCSDTAEAVEVGHFVGLLEFGGWVPRVYEAWEEEEEEFDEVMLNVFALGSWYQGIEGILNLRLRDE